MSTALKEVNRKVSAQTIQDTPDQVQNNAGGFVFEVSDRDRLERFLILGTDKGTYYVSEQKITDENVKFISRLIAKNERMVLDTVVAVSQAGRAHKNSQALFVMAMLFADGKDKAAASAALPLVARTSTHLFEFAQYLENITGWGRAKRNAVSNWYTSQSADKLAYQAVKYRQRDGWTHRDLLLLSHAKDVDSAVAEFIVKGTVTNSSPAIIRGFKAAQSAKTVDEVLAVLNEFQNLPWETLPTEFHSDPRVWKALFHNGQLNGQALIRNIIRLERNGAFKDMAFARAYADRLIDEEMILKTRLHPINYLAAAVTYHNGQKGRGIYSYQRNKDWKETSVIVDALNEGYHRAFKAVEPANKRTFIALDVSGSMSSEASGIDLSCAQVGAAIAMTVARTEPMYEIRGFTSSGNGPRTFGNYDRGVTLTDLGITAKSDLNDAMNKAQRANFGRTDCSLPMTYALKNKIEVDTFVVITDNETYDGKIKPSQALKQYRDKMGIDARLAVFGVTATKFTIADPKDKGMLDFVGFDSNAPRALTDFSAGRL